MDQTALFDRWIARLRHEQPHVAVSVREQPEPALHHGSAASAASPPDTPHTGPSTPAVPQSGAGPAGRSSNRHR